MPSWDVRFDSRVQTDNLTVVSLVAKYHALASVINNIPITPKRALKLDRLNIMRTVRGTTGIEGAQLTEEEVKSIMETPLGTKILPPSRNREEQEARNALKLTAYVA